MSLTAACPRRMPWHLLERARILRAHRKARAASPRCLSYVASGQPTFVTRVDAACLDRVARSREFAHDVCDDERGLLVSRTTSTSPRAGTGTAVLGRGEHGGQRIARSRVRASFTGPLARVSRGGLL